MSRLNRAVDRCLLAPHASAADALPRPACEGDASRIAERVRRRATRLGRAERGLRKRLIRNRDRLIQMLYAQAAPADWCVAWSDGSAGALRAGIGGLILAARDRSTVAELSEPAAPGDALSIELAAVIAVLGAALESRVERLRVYTDCGALVELWLRHRDDPRLAELRSSARRLQGFDLRSLPRQHNQPAHRLARSAVTGSSPGD